MNIIKSIIVYIWAIWMVILLGIMLFASGPLEIEMVSPIVAGWLLYGLTFGLPLILLVILRFERD